MYAPTQDEAATADPGTGREGAHAADPRGRGTVLRAPHAANPGGLERVPPGAAHEGHTNDENDPTGV